MEVADEGGAKLTKRSLFDVWRTTTETIKHVAVADHLKLRVLNSEDENVAENIRRFAYRLSQQFKEKWVVCSRNTEKFEEKNSKWLSGEIDLQRLSSVCTADEASANNNAAESAMGRPQVPFEDASTKTKMRRVKDLTDAHSSAELVFAAESTLRAEGQRKSATNLRALMDDSSSSTAETTIVPYSPNEALAMIVDSKMTAKTYDCVRSGAIERNCPLYPSYDAIKKAKSECYPPPESMKVTDTSAELSLQSLVDLTVRRLIEAQSEVFETQEINATTYLHYNMVFKWGIDGSSSHSNYKQHFKEAGEGETVDGEEDGANEEESEEDTEDEEEEEVEEANSQAEKPTKKKGPTDSTIILICFVPLQLYAFSGNEKYKQVIWNNSRPSSVRYCRPLKFCFEKESADFVTSTIDDVKKQIRDLRPTNVIVNGHSISIGHIFRLTMVDGKVVSFLTGVPAQNCSICKATPRQMNKLQLLIRLPRDTAVYEHGLSSLHMWIRALEWILSVSYRIDIQKWSVRTPEDKTTMEAQKNQVRDKLRSSLGILVHVTKQGSGNTNDGNTARTFFQNPGKVAEITRIDQNLLERIHIILQVISSGHAINIPAFREYLAETFDLYVNLYEWYYMPASIHKLLIHGADIIETAILPIGVFSEEAQESRNKDLRRYREHHTRKMSRECTNLDLMRMLLVSSDPVINSFRRIVPKMSGPLSPHAIKLLIPAEPDVYHMLVHFY